MLKTYHHMVRLLYLVDPTILISNLDIPENAILSMLPGIRLKVGYLINLNLL